jgi:hypothetical protein
VGGGGSPLPAHSRPTTGQRLEASSSTAPVECRLNAEAGGEVRVSEFPALCSQTTSQNQLPGGGQQSEKVGADRTDESEFTSRRRQTTDDGPQSAEIGVVRAYAIVTSSFFCCVLLLQHALKFHQLLGQCSTPYSVLQREQTRTRICRRVRQMPATRLRDSEEPTDSVMTRAKACLAGGRVIQAAR